MTRTAVILAAGFGTRMKSALPKTLHRIAGRSMLRHLLASCEEMFDRIVVVVGPEMDAVRQEAAPHVVVVQQERRGTAHAALVAAPLFGDGEVAVLYADNPLIRPETLRRLIERRVRGDVALALLAFRPVDPARNGRVIMHERYVERIVEWVDADEADRAETLCNAGVLCAASADMICWLEKVIPSPADADSRDSRIGGNRIHRGKRWRFAMAAAIALRGDCDSGLLRELAKQSEDADQVRRLLALAVVYDGGSRSDGARAGGVGLQTFRDWVLRFNAAGPTGLVDGKAPGQAPRLDQAQRDELARLIEDGPVPAVHGVVRWRLSDLAQWVMERYRTSVSEQTLSRYLRTMGYRKLSARPRHHAQNPEAVSAFKKTSLNVWQRSRLAMHRASR